MADGGQAEGERTNRAEEEQVYVPAGKCRARGLQCVIDARGGLCISCFCSGTGMAENTAFSSSGEEVIARTIEVDQEDVPREESLEAYYDIERTVQEISKGDYKRVRFNSPLLSRNSV